MKPLEKLSTNPLKNDQAIFKIILAGAALILSLSFFMHIYRQHFALPAEPWRIKLYYHHQLILIVTQRPEESYIHFLTDKKMGTLLVDEFEVTKGRT